MRICSSQIVTRRQPDMAALVRTPDLTAVC